MNLYGRQNFTESQFQTVNKPPQHLELSHVSHGPYSVTRMLFVPAFSSLKVQHKKTATNQTKTQHCAPSSKIFSRNKASSPPASLSKK